MVVFEGLRDGPVVNTGDFRYSDALLKSPALQRVARAVDGKRVQQLRLDASWANIDRLPSKQHSAELLLEILSSFSYRVFIISHLGDEEMLRAIAWRHPGEKLWFTDERRYHEFSAAEPSLAASQAVMLHREPDENVRFVIIRQWSDRLNDRRLRDAQGAGICMSTLWFARAGMDMHAPAFSEIWRVPFSMHSSGEELEALVSYLDPAIIVPHTDPIVGGPAMVGGQLVGGQLTVGEKAMPAVDKVHAGTASSEVLSPREFDAAMASVFRPHATPQVEDDLEALLAGAFDSRGFCTQTVPETPVSTLVDTPSPFVDTPSPKRHRI